MAGRYDHDELFIALQRHGKTEEEAEVILNEIDSKGTHDFSMQFDSARKLAAEFHDRHELYNACMWGDMVGGYVSVRVVSKCVDRRAPWVKCVVCGTEVKTCEREIPVDGDYRCPVHPEGTEISDGRWACSPECWEIAKKHPDRYFLTA